MPREGYPKKSYSIASIEAMFKNSNMINFEHCYYNINKYIESPKLMTKEVTAMFKETYLQTINSYDFITISTYSWTEEIVTKIMALIREPYKGKIILGGYSITAQNKEELLTTFYQADYYIKGFAEKSFETIFNNEAQECILDNIPEAEYFKSPYLLDIINTDTDKIYWETKRGCPYTCGFCEWGTAAKRNIIRLDRERLSKEIKLFSKSSIQEINIIDGTFLIDETDYDVLKELLENTNCKVTIQVRFETIQSKLGEKFLKLCHEYREKLNLEFGLQTIHSKEMIKIDRDNNMANIKSIMHKLAQLNIDYVVSIIYGIPGQTVDSFKETIEYIHQQKCKRIKAFPLRLPNNSKLRAQKQLKIKEKGLNDFPLKYVSESYSFNEEEWREMGNIANNLTMAKAS